MSQDRVLSLRQIEDLARNALSGCGARDLQLQAATSSIVEAEADGIRTVGLGYLPTYCEQLKSGKIVGSARPTHEQVSGAAIAGDAAYGFSFAAFQEAKDDFHALAHKQGLAALAVRRSSSAGVLGWFVERIANAGLIGIGFANSSALMTPHGGTGAFFGTNPVAFSVPRANGLPPLIADMATSQVAYVTVKEYAEKGMSIPLGWGLDRYGQPTTDPNDVLDGGAMAPAGGHKGTLLAMLVDILAGGLAGPNFSFQASKFAAYEGDPPEVGQLFIALNPQTFTDLPHGPAAFSDRLEAMLTALTADGGVHLPGSGRHERRERAATDGVAVPETLIAALTAYA